MVEWGGRKSSKLNREWITSSKSCGAGPEDSQEDEVLCKNAFQLLPWPFRQQVSNSCSSFFSLKRSYHLPHMTDPDCSPSGCCKTCFCCAQGEIKCIWEHVSPDFLLPWVALHLLPGAVEYHERCLHPSPAALDIDHLAFVQNTLLCIWTFLK